MPRKSRHKYGAIKVETPDGTFDSKLEHARWEVLKMLRAAGEINDLQRQQRYNMHVNGQLICYMVPDFQYRLGTDINNDLVIEDAKSNPTKTRAYRIKKKLMLALHGHDIREVHKAREDIR